MKKLIALALALVMVAALFAGCGEAKAPETTVPTLSEQEKLVGIWKGEMDITESMKESMGEEMEGFELEDMSVTVILTFTEEGAYTLKLDEETLSAAIDSLLKSIRSYLKEGMEKEAQAEGMTADQMLGALGMTLDEFVDAMLESFEEMDLGGEIAKQFKVQGKSLAEDGKIYISDSVDTDPDKTVYLSYTLEGDVLTLTERVGGEAPAEGETGMTFPMILKKAE